MEWHTAMSAHRFSSALAALLAGVALAAVTAAPAAADFIDFNTDLTGFKSDGFQSDDSSLAKFYSPPIGGFFGIFAPASVPGAQVTNRVLGSQPGFAMNFVSPATTLSFDFGHDSTALPPGTNAILTLYNQGQQVGQATVPVNRNFLVDQRIAFSGGPFDRATFQFDQSNPLVIVVDNIEFSSNRPPVADAGPDQELSVPHDGNLATATAAIHLDGSHSSDPDVGDTIVRYEWKEGATTLSDEAVVDVARAPGDYVFTLTVTDSHGATASDELHVHVPPEPNGSPTVSAGADQAETVAHDGEPTTADAVFTLVGSTSDPDGDALTTEWREGETLLGSGPSLALSRPAGTYTFTLKATDTYGASSVDDVTVVISPETNQAPVARAGADQTVAVSGPHTTVALDGTASSDPDGSADALTFSWTGGGVGLGTDAALSVRLTPGVHHLILTVTDPYGLTDRDEVIVQVLYSWSGVLAPVKADGISVFKLGRTVPVKFQLTGACAGITDLQARLSYNQLAGPDAIGDVNEAESTSAATSGNLFRYDPSSGQYIFNWDTRGLQAGKYELLIDFGDGTPRRVYVGLK